jgi:HEPN domain-containing protein
MISGVSAGAKGTGMDDQEKYAHWLAHAQEDLLTAEAMLKAKRWMYVAFCCQQSIEKSVKGLYGLYRGFDNIPYVHNIAQLMNALAGSLPQPIPQEKYDLFDILTRHYLNNRYPDYIDDLSAQIQEDTVQDIFTKTSEAFIWLQTLKP